MPFNVACSKLPPIVLGIALISLSGCATVGSDAAGEVAVCPPVVEYDQAFRERAAGEIELLPDRSNIERIMQDYLVLRAQIRGCSAAALE